LTEKPDVNDDAVFLAPEAGIKRDRVFFYSKIRVMLSPPLPGGTVLSRLLGALEAPARPHPFPQ